MWIFKFPIISAGVGLNSFLLRGCGPSLFLGLAIPPVPAIFRLSQSHELPQHKKRRTQRQKIRCSLFSHRFAYSMPLLGGLAQFFWSSNTILRLIPDESPMLGHK